MWCQNNSQFQSLTIECRIMKQIWELIKSIGTVQILDDIITNYNFLNENIKWPHYICLFSVFSKGDIWRDIPTSSDLIIWSITSMFDMTKNSKNMILTFLRKTKRGLATSCACTLQELTILPNNCVLTFLHVNIFVWKVFRHGQEIAKHVYKCVVFLLSFPLR